MLGVVVAIAALVPLLRSTSQLPAGTTPAACVGGAQVAATDDSFVAVPVDGGAEQGQLYTFDSTSGAPIGSPITVGYDPVAMAVDTTWSKLYVVNQGGGTNPASVSVIDYENGLGVATTIPLPSGADPESIAVSPGGSHVVVADTGLGELSVINPQDDKIVGTISLGGGAEAATLAYAPDADTLYVGDTALRRIDVLEFTSSSPPYYTVQSYASGYYPGVFATSGSTLYSGDGPDDVVDVFTMGHSGGTGTLTFEKSWSTPSVSPLGLAVTRSGATLYVTSGSTTFLEIDTTSGAQSSEDAPAGSGVGALATNADGTVLEMAETNQYAVARWGVDENAAQDAVTGLSGLPSAVVSVPSTALRFFAYVAQSASINSDQSGDVSVVDLVSDADIADIPVGVNPEAVAASPSGSSVYVADTGSGSNGSLDAVNTADINTGTDPVRSVSTNPAIPFSSGAFPNALALSPAGDELLVSDFNRGVVYDIELNTPAPHTMTTIGLDGGSGTTGYEPVAIAMSPSGRYAYVSDNNDKAITVLETNGMDQPFTFDQKVVPSPAVSAPHGAAVAPDGRSLYVADETGSALDVYPILGTGLIGTGTSVPLDADPEDVAVSPSGSPIYVAEAGTDQTAVVNAGSLAVTQLTAGPLPSGVAVTPDTGEFLVTNDNTCSGAGSMWIYRAGQTAATAKVNFDIGGVTVTNPFAVAVAPGFSAPATPQSLPAAELSGGGVNPAEVATRTAAEDVRAGVDTATGSYSISPPGLSVASPGLPLDFSATYDSANAATSGPLGKGWTFSYGVSLSLVLVNAKQNLCEWEVSQENSSIASFADVRGSNSCSGDPVGDFAPTARVQASLETGSNCPGSGSCYVFTRQGVQRFFFSEQAEPNPWGNGLIYRLLGEQDRYGNTVTLAYGGGNTCDGSQLSTVTAQGAGLSGTRTLSFGWNCTLGTITSVVDPLGREVALTYDGNGNLEQYTLSGGGDRLAAHTFTFSYDSSHDLVNWWDPDNAQNTSNPSDGTTIGYATYSSPNQACTSSFTAATSVTGPQVSGQGTRGTTTFHPETTLNYGSYDLCTGDGAVVVADPNQTAGLGAQSADTTLDYYIGRALLSTTSGYGHADAGIVDDNEADGQPDASSAVTIYVRDPETLAAREVVDPDGNLTATEWNALGDPVVVTDANGHTSSYLYNPDNEVTESVDPLGRTTTYTYSEPLLTAVTDPAGNVTRYLQAEDGETCEVLSPDAAAAHVALPASCGTAGGELGVTTTTFDAYGDVASVTDPDGDVTSNAYDDDGELCGTLSPDGYVANGTLLRSCPAASGGPYLTVYPFHDVYGDLLQKATPAQAGEPNGNSWLTYYDADGRKVAAMTPQDTGCDGNTTSNCTYATYDGYDAEGDLISVTDGYGDSGGPNETTYTYDADGNRLSAISPDGNASQDRDSYRTVYTYDDLGRLVATEDPRGGSGCDPQTSTVLCPFTSYDAYDPAGRLVAATTPATTADPDGTTTTTTYDAAGNVLQVLVSDVAAGTTISETTKQYDAANELTASIAPDGYLAGQTAANWQTSYTYDGDGRLSSETAPAGEGSTSGAGAGSGKAWYFYDGDGNKVAVTNGDGDTCNAAVNDPQNPPVCPSTTYYGYDLADRLTSVTGAAGQASSTETTSTYDADGNPRVVTNPSAVTTTSTYDSADELTGVAYSDGTPAVSYGYNIDGTRASMAASGAGSYDFTYAYDESQRLTSLHNGSATVASYGYDNSGNVTTLTYPSGLVVTNAYAVDSELSSASWGSGNDLSFAYNEDGTLQTTTEQAGSGNPTVTTADSYDDGQRLDDVSTSSTAQSQPIVVTNYYDQQSSPKLQLDPNGNPLGEEVTTGEVNQPTVYYGVDFVNRANYDSTTAPSQTPVAASDQTGTYDKANFVTQGSAIAVQQYYGDGEIEQATTTGPGPQTASFAYDPEQDRIGESTPTATTSYAFDAAGQMCWSAPTASIPAGGSTPDCSSPPAGATTYTYDGDGLRESETTSSGTQTFAWDTEGGTPRLLEDGQDDYVYGPGGTPLAQVALGSGAVDFLISDREGSVRDVVSGTTGLSLADTDYDLYGNPTTSGGLSLLTPFGFQGGYTDATGLVYFEQRYYDPGSGQFLSLDPLNDMTNSGYTFVNDNPLVGSDPTGTLLCGGGGDCSGYGGSGSGPPPPPPPEFTANTADQELLAALSHTAASASSTGPQTGDELSSTMATIAQYAGLLPLEQSGSGCVGVGGAVLCTLIGLWLTAPLGSGLGDLVGGVVDGVRVLRAARAAVDVGDAAEGGAAGDVPQIEVSSSQYPESAAHIEDAQAAGQPSELTIDRAGAAANRAASLRGTDPIPGLDRDEYPPAMFSEGGEGASVRGIDPSDNRGAGSTMGWQCRPYPDGTVVCIVVVP